MKIIKNLLLGVFGLIILATGFIILANTLFTTKLELSCSGEYVETLNGKIQKQEKDLRALQIEITTLPFQKQHVIAQSGSILIISSDEDRNSDTNTTMVMATDVDIIAGNRFTNSSTSAFNAITFNRITKAVKIEANWKYIGSGDYREEVFNGECKQTKPI